MKLFIPQPSHGQFVAVPFQSGFAIVADPYKLTFIGGRYGVAHALVPAETATRAKVIILELMDAVCEIVRRFKQLKEQAPSHMLLPDEEHGFTPITPFSRRTATEPVAIIDVAAESPCSPTALFCGFGYIPVNEPFVFSVDGEHVSVSMGAGGAVIAKIAIGTRTQIEDFIFCLGAVLDHIANRHELYGEGAITNFLGAGVCVEVRRHTLAVHVKLVTFTPRTLVQMTHLVATLNQLLKEVKGKALAYQDGQLSECGRQHRNFVVAG